LMVLRSGGFVPRHDGWRKASPPRHCEPDCLQPGSKQTLSYTNNAVISYGVSKQAAVRSHQHKGSLIVLRGGGFVPRHDGWRKTSATRHCEPGCVQPGSKQTLSYTNNAVISYGVSKQAAVRSHQHKGSLIVLRGGGFVPRHDGWGKNRTTTLRKCLIKK
jgi:ribosomal protein S6E (S10)